MLLVNLMFATSFYLINLNRDMSDPESSVMPYVFNTWFIDAFYVVFVLGLGEVDADNMIKSPYPRIFLCLLVLVVFFAAIVFLNMLIAIMGNVF